MSKNVLSRNQRRALAALIEHATIIDAAEACSLTTKTLSRYLDDQQFRAALMDAESKAIKEATRRLLGLQAAAVDTFDEIFRRSGELAGFNVAEIFTEQEYKDPETGFTARRLVLDIDKVKEFGHLVKKLKTDGGDLEVESYNAQIGDRLRLQAAQGVFDYLLRLRELQNIEQRITDLEVAVYGQSK